MNNANRQGKRTMPIDKENEQCKYKAYFGGYFMSLIL